MNAHPTPVPNAQVSRVDAPCLLFGTVGVCIGVLMHLVGLFQHADDRLISLLLDPVFQGERPEVLSLPLLVVVAAIFSYALTFAVLDSHGVLRRVILGVTVLVLVLTIQPTLAVWNIYFSPFLPVVSVFLAWFFSLMYANHYVMPCDVAHLSHQLHSQRSEPVVSTDVAMTVTREEKDTVSVSDPNEKYKPQNLKEEVKDKKEGRSDE